MNSEPSYWAENVSKVKSSAAKPDPIFRVQPVFGMKKRVESGRVEPSGSKFGLNRVGLTFFKRMYFRVEPASTRQPEIVFFLLFACKK